MNLRHVSQSPVSQELAHRRLEQLQGDGATDGWNAERRIVAEAIFGRAPEDYLRRTSIDTLRAIAKDTHESIKTFLREQKPYRVLVRSHDPREARGGYTSIEIVMWDRPFIVDSLTEYFRVNDIRYHVLLHPIIRSDSELVSLTYIEMDRIDEAEQLTKTIEQILDDVLLVTSSFQPIQVEIVRAHERLSADLPTTRAPETTTSALPVANEDPYAREEIVRFLEWLLDGDFIFLGSRSWTRGPAGELAERKKLGMFDSNDADIRRQLEIATGDAKLLVDSGAPIMFSKLAPRSRVHRRIYHDLVLVSVPATGDAPAEVLAIIGMHTSRAIAQDVSMIPIARRKLANLLRGEELLPNTYDYKEAVTILNLLTKSSMFRMSEQSLQQQLRIMMSIQRRGETKVLPLDLVPGRFASLLVVMPAGRFSSTVADEISEYLESKFDVPSGAIDRRVASGEESLVAIFFLVPNLRIDDIAPRMAEIERDIAEITLSWEDRLFQMLTVRSGKAVASRLLDFYWDALPDDYKASFSADEAVLDIGVLESLSGEKPIEIALRPCRPDNTSHAEECVDLRIFRRGKGLTLSQTIPLLENAGFHIVDENVFVIGSAQEPWATICSLTVRPKRPTTLSAALVDERILPGLRAVFTEQAENDPLNALLANPGLTIREIAMVRLYAHYLWQIKSAPAESVISAAIVENPTLVRIFVDAFRLRFDPDLYAADMTTRLKTFAETKVRFIEALKSVSLLAHDRVLRAMFNVLESSVRTNYYQTDYQLRLAVKIDCQSVTSMPRPRPMFEIFLCSPEVEGLHLRGGKVARGGIRWSERPEDFRTEVLGLMKTQMIKNSIIVPVGAKGGFIVKSRGAAGKVSLDDVVHCYRLFIRSLLEITDNRRDGVVSHPPRSVTYDNQDPYFVVAADKGTAAFSDIANEIAEKEFDLWIGDAFASGGSQGYSHKKFGITARGAWEAALVHFRELGLDPEREPFTVVGIGDMSGDVFGNGLIISKHAKLLGAFDHRQIFVDPNPDCATSFEERKRLFELPRSSWSDYNKALISQGGGVFPRDSKSIPVTPEMRVALGIAATIESLTGQELIQAILRAPVDLLWNGGIGTYVKAPFEDHSHAADRANDDVRIDATELRARAVAEGGNLGFTQLGRTSYAEAGGHINTDAIDNSGGVDLSDHEVNLKILLSAPVRRGELTVEERTKLLLECVDEVCESVIARNRAQSTAISLIVEKSSSRLTYHGGYIRKLHREGAIDRRSDGLPDDETLARRATEGKGLYRPEAALLLAYAKMRAYNIMLRSSIADDPYLDGLLFRYFPSRIADKFSRDIAQHPLRAEIICTQVANILFERLDPTFLFRLSEELGVSKERVIRAFLAAYEFLRCAPLVAALERSEHPGNVRVVRVAYHRIASTLFRATRWLLQHHDTEKNIGAVVDYFAPGFQTLQAHVRETLSPADRQRHDTIYQRFVSGEISPDVAAHLTSFVFVVPLMEVIDIAEVEDRGLLDVAKLYAYLSSELEIGKLLTKVEQPDLKDPQDVTAWRELFSQMRDVTGGILRAVVVERESVTVDAGAAFLADRVDAVARVRAITKEYDKRPLSLGALYTLCQRFEALQRPKQP